MRLVPMRFREGRHRFQERRPGHDIPRAVHHAVLVPDPLTFLDRRGASLLGGLEHRGEVRRDLVGGALDAVDREGDAARIRLAPQQPHAVTLLLFIVVVVGFVVGVVFVERSVGVVGGVLVFFFVCFPGFRLRLDRRGLDFLLGRAVPLEQHVHRYLALLLQRADL